MWIANAATAVGMMSFLPFFASHVERLGESDPDRIALWAGVLFGAAPLSAALMSPVWGSLGDRVGRRAMVVRSMLAITVFVGAMALARTPTQLLVLRLLQGLFSGFLAPSLTLVSVSAPPHVQGRMAGSLQVALTLGAILGPAWGEVMGRLGGIPLVYASVALLALASSVLVLAFAKEDGLQHRAPLERLSLGVILRATRDDWRALRSNPSLRTAFALSFWLQFGMNATLPLLELYQRSLPSPWGWSAIGAGALFSAAAVANLLGAPLWGRMADRGGAFRALLWCAGACALALALHGAAHNFESLLGVRVLMGLAIGGAGPLAFGVAAAETPVERRGGAFGIMFAARTLAVALAAFSGGLLARWMSMRGLFVASGALLLCYLVWSWRDRRRAGAPRTMQSE